jgi:predicted lipid-binding transport protein (Tim44 family)
MTFRLRNDPSPVFVRHRSESECDVDIFTIIFLALAVFIFLRLRSVLGQRTGSESAPYDRATRDIAPRDLAARDLAARDLANGASNSNVVPLPGTVADHAPLAPTETAPAPERWKGVAEPGSALAQGFDAIAVTDSSFDPQHFLSGARGAYEMIVLAFANGDRRTLKDLLSKDVYDGFDNAIREREQREQKTETRFVGIDKAELVSAEMRDRLAQVTVRFVSQMVTVTHDKAGTVVDGSPEKVTDVTDIWTFAREISSRDPNWKLVGTESGH